MKKIKLLTLTTSFPLTDESTSGVFVRNLVIHLPAYFAVTVLTPCSDAPLPEVSEKEPGSHYQLKCFRYATQKWQLLAHQPGGIPVAMSRSRLMALLIPAMLVSQLIACMREAVNMDVIHANWSINGFVASIAGWFTRTPVITTIRGEDASRARNSALYRGVLRFCLRRNHRLVCVSQAITAQLKKQFPGWAHKIGFMPNGIQDSFLSIPVIHDSPDKKTFNVLSVGSLIPRKDIATIIQALKIVTSTSGSQCDYQLTIIGDGPEENQLQERVTTLGLESQVNFVGSVRPEKIIDYYSQTDVFILASLSEGRANVILESLAAGVPVIASDIDGNRELINGSQNGLLFTTGDPASLSQKLKTVQSDPVLRKQLSKNGRRFIIDNKLTWTETGVRYANLFEHCLKQDVSSECVE